MLNYWRDRLKDLVQEFLDDDPAYQEWSETIQKQNQQQLEADLANTVVIDLSNKSWEDVLNILNPKANSSEV